mmetsp:Transcript_1644/g.3840  ORF Transcript_1644/g.3840 Transcript_1644/m.3840 type:complete len:161 (-) Transcript_1644:174-656(-)
MGLRASSRSAIPSPQTMFPSKSCCKGPGTPTHLRIGTAPFTGLPRCSDCLSGQGVAQLAEAVPGCPTWSVAMPTVQAETLRGSRPSETKRVRMEKDELEKLLFSLFEKRPNWSLSDLVEATDQPQAWLKEILLQVAVLNKKGNVKGSYALKPEYAVNLPG